MDKVSFDGKGGDDGGNLPAGEEGVRRSGRRQSSSLLPLDPSSMPASGIDDFDFDPLGTIGDGNNGNKPPARR